MSLYCRIFPNKQQLLDYYEQKLVDIDSDRTGTKADNASSTSVGGATSRFIEPLLRYSLPDRCVEPPPPPPPTPNHGESLERQRFEDIIINLSVNRYLMNFIYNLQ